ncbi:hypothetical protein [Methylobacterium gregans]|nr:hypothetical protein [Methylobacterium gregans]
MRRFVAPEAVCLFVPPGEVTRSSERRPPVRDCLDLPIMGRPIWV